MSFDLKRQFIAQLVETSRLLRNYIDHRAKTRGTTRAQWIVLFRLREQEGLSQVDLAEVLELQPISLVRLLDRLVEHELLERRQDPKDRRANRLFLTERGRQLVDDLDSLRDAIATDVLHDVADERIRTSLDTLRDVKDRIKGLGEHSCRGQVAGRSRRPMPIPCAGRATEMGRLFCRSAERGLIVHRSQLLQKDPIYRHLSQLLERFLELLQSKFRTI